MFIFVLILTVHGGGRDDNSYGRHINLHLTYSFQQQANNNKSSLFGPPGNY